MNSLRAIESLWQDIRYAGRLLRRNPGFALVAILSLALGIGANTLVFSVVNALLVEPLPIDRPEQVVFLQSGSPGVSHSFPTYRDYRDHNSTLSGLIGYRIAPMSLETGGGARHVWGYLATGNYFDVLGVDPVIGRVFPQEDDRTPGASPYAVLSYDCWQGRFSGDPRIVGETIRINQLAYTVLGVAPRGFHGTELWYRAEIWVPMMMQPQIEARGSWLDNRGTHNTWIAGRLKPDVTVAAAEGDLNAIATEVAREREAQRDQPTIRLTRPGLMGDALRTPVKAFTLGVLILAGLVLLASSANLATMLLARGADRQREMALRLSIGAGQRRLVRQLLTEALLLALAGGLAGAALAALLSKGLSAWRAPADFPVQLDVQTNASVFLFAFGVSLVAAVAFGLTPSRQASRIDPNTALKGIVDGARGGRRRWALRDALVALQVALCFVLLSACLLSLKGLQHALTMPLGFEPQGVSVASFELGLAGYSEEEGRAFRKRALAAVSRLPGVQSAAYANSLPLSIDQSTTRVSSNDASDRRSSEGVGANYYQVSPGFFRTLGVQLLAGRDFEWRDGPGSSRVAIVNQTFAQRVFQTTDAIGKRFRWGGDSVEVVGVVEDGKYVTLTEATPAVLFWPMLQFDNTTTTLVARSALPEEQVVAQMRQVVTGLDPDLPLYGTGSLQQLLRFVRFPSQAAAIALSAFGLLALMLAATGIHGVVAYAVARRRREIGIRIAVGATPWEIIRLVLARMAALLATGAALGFLLAHATGHLLTNIVYQASPGDPLVMMAVAALMVAIGTLSCWRPVRQSLRIDPVTALRSE